MAKHHRKYPRDKEKYARIRTFAPEEFRMQVLGFLEARQNPSIPAQREGHALAIDSANLTPYSVYDGYSNPWDSMSAYWRFQALLRMVQKHDFSPFVYPVENGLEMADELFYVAATAPIDAKGEFLLEPFREALAQWGKEHPDRGKEMTE